MDVRSKFVEEDMESVDFKDCVATVLSEAIRNEVGELGGNHPICPSRRNLMSLWLRVVAARKD